MTCSPDMAHNLLQVILRSYEFTSTQNAITLRPMTYAWYTTSDLCLWLKLTLDVTMPVLRPRKDLFYDLTPKSSDNKSFFINSSEIWKVLFLLLELESFILALSIEVLEGFILVFLLDGHVQVVRSLKVSFLLFELESFIFTLLLEATGRERENDRVWFLYDWYLAAPKAVGPGTIRIWKKLYRFIRPTHLRVSALISKAEGCRYWNKRSNIRRSKRSEVQIGRS